MSSFIHCDGCGRQAAPDETEEWVKLFIPLPPDTTTNPMADVMAMMTGKGSQPKYESLEFCTLSCVVTGCIVRNSLLTEKS